jgi:hypothetical protein
VLSCDPAASSAIFAAICCTPCNQDDEVDRLERSSKPGGWLGLGRQDVMDSMYGRIDPRPAGALQWDVLIKLCQCLFCWLALVVVLGLGLARQGVLDSTHGCIGMRSAGAARWQLPTFCFCGNGLGRQDVLAARAAASTRNQQARIWRGRLSPVCCSGMS